MTIAPRWWGAVLAMAMAGSVSAQSDDPIAAAADDDAAQTASDWTWFGDFLLRGDQTRDLPLNLPDEVRTVARGRIGARWQATESIEIGGAIEGSHGADSIRLLRRSHDNQRATDINLDRLYARWHWGEQTALTLGRNALPLELSPMVWDNELRPTGVSIEHGMAIGDFDRLTFSGGAFEIDHPYTDVTRLVAAQVGWRLREGAPTRGGILFSFLGFDDIDEIGPDGLARGNRRTGQGLTSDYRLGDLQFVFDTPLAGRSLEARLDLVHNFGADDLNQGARGSLVWGDSRQPQSWELGLSYQRIQRDAVLAAFNAEDWWFHAAMRGVMPWVGYGFDDHWRVRLAMFVEGADGQDLHTKRTLLDVRGEW